MGGNCCGLPRGSEQPDTAPKIFPFGTSTIVLTDTISTVFSQKLREDASEILPSFGSKLVCTSLASWRTAGERSSFPCVSSCSSNQIQTSQQPSPPRRAHSRISRCGSVPSAAESCRLSSDSLSHNFFSDLRLLRQRAQHEYTSPDSNLPRAAARLPPLCLVPSKSTILHRCTRSHTPICDVPLRHHVWKLWCTRPDGNRAKHPNHFAAIQFP